jgi:hypothetical protein
MNVPKFFTDELFYSWACRAYKINAFSSLSDFAVRCVLGGDIIQSRFLKADFEPQTIIASYLQIDPLILFQKTSMYPAIAPFLTPGQSLEIVNHAFNWSREKHNLFYPVVPTSQSLKFCPKCTHGELIFTRHCNMPGTLVCPICGSPLYEIPIDRLSADVRRAVKCPQPADHDTLLNISRFGMRLLELSPDVLLTQTTKVILDRLVEFDIRKNDKFIAYINDRHASALFTPQIKYVIRLLGGHQEITPANTLSLLTLLFDSADEFVKCLDIPDPSAIVNDLPEGFTPEICRNTICRVKHLCGNSFYTTPLGILDGFGCPVCDESLSDQEIFKRMVAVAGKRQYTVLEPVKTFKASVRLIHSCGRELKASPSSFLIRGHRCSCRHILTSDDVQKLVEARPGFYFISYKEGIVTVRHKCGYVFSRRLDYFKSQGCPACDTRNLTEGKVIKAIKDLTGSEYTLIRFLDKGKCVIRHNACGRESEYLTGCFLRGTRCPKCHRCIREKKLAAMIKIRSGGRYSYAGSPKKYHTAIKDNDTGEIIVRKRNFVIQEFTRPTKSDIYPHQKS